MANVNGQRQGGVGATMITIIIRMLHKTVIQGKALFIRYCTWLPREIFGTLQIYMRVSRTPYINRMVARLQTHYSCSDLQR
jgi:hypothetical protein